MPRPEGSARFIRPLVALVLCAALLGASPAGAVLLVSESFTESPGPLNGLGAGSGWNGPWVTGQASVFVVQAAGLTGGFGSTGGSLFFDGSHAISGTGARILRAFDLGPASIAAAAGVVENTTTRYNGVEAAFGKPGTTVWLGVVFNGGTAGSGIAGSQYLDQVHLYDGATTTGAALAQGDNNKDGEALAIGRGNGNTVWNYERTCAHDDCPNLSTSSTSYLSTVTLDSATHWLVMRFDFVSAATTQITTWLDPAPGTTTPTNASALTIAGLQVVSVTGLHFNWIEMGGQTSQFSFDEVRLATTFGELSYDGTLAVHLPPTTTLALGAQPSPFTDRVTFSFVLHRAQVADLRVLDVAGHVVRSLAEGTSPAGVSAVSWDGRDDAGLRVPAGLYFVQLRCDEGRQFARIARLP